MHSELFSELLYMHMHLLP